MKAQKHYSEADYRRPGALTGAMSADQRQEMDGVPVTVVVPDWHANGPQGPQGPPTDLAVVPGICRPQFSLLPIEFRCYVQKPSRWPDELYRWDDEGVTWIRGHHALDSKEVAALRVAHALGRTTP